MKKRFSDFFRKADSGEVVLDGVDLIRLCEFVYGLRIDEIELNQVSYKKEKKRLGIFDTKLGDDLLVFPHSSKVRSAYIVGHTALKKFGIILRVNPSTVKSYFINIDDTYSAYPISEDLATLIAQVAKISSREERNVFENQLCINLINSIKKNKKLNDALVDAIEKI